MDALAGVFQQIAQSRAVGFEAVIVAWVAGVAAHDAADGEAAYGAVDEVVYAGRLT